VLSGRRGSRFLLPGLGCCCLTAPAVVGCPWRTSASHFGQCSCNDSSGGGLIGHGKWAEKQTCMGRHQQAGGKLIVWVFKGGLGVLVFFQRQPVRGHTGTDGMGGHNAPNTKPCITSNGTGRYMGWASLGKQKGGGVLGRVPFVLGSESPDHGSLKEHMDGVYVYCTIRYITCESHRPAGTDSSRPPGLNVVDAAQAAGNEPLPPRALGCARERPMTLARHLGAGSPTGALSQPGSPNRRWD
jgi:hypothetical protein